MAQDTTSSPNTTIFVETEPNSFRDLVQRLTGKFPVIKPKPPPMKLHQRRQPLRPNLEIMKPDSLNHRGGLKSPSTVFTTLSITDEYNNSPCSHLELDVEEEKKAIEAKRFYLHPSPRSRSGGGRPELLVLFPLTSPGGES